MMNIKESFFKCKKKSMNKGQKKINSVQQKKIKTFKKEPNEQDKLKFKNDWKKKRLRLIKEDFSIFFKSSEFLSNIYDKYLIDENKNLFQQIFKFVLIKFLKNNSDLFTNKYQLQLLEEYIQDEFKKEFVNKLNRLFIEKSSRFKSRKGSLILIGPSGSGKKTLVQSYCNSNDILLQKCDFSLYRNLKQFVDNYGNTNKFQNLFFNYKDKIITRSDEKKKNKNKKYLNFSGSKKKVRTSKQKLQDSLNKKTKKKKDVTLLNYFSKSNEIESQKQLTQFISKSKLNKYRIKDFFNEEQNIQNKDINMLQNIKLKKVFMCYNLEFLQDKPINELTNQLKQIQTFVSQSSFPFIFILGQECKSILEIMKKQSDVVHLKQNYTYQNYFLLLSILIIEKNFQHLKKLKFNSIQDIERYIMDKEKIELPNKIFIDILIKDIANDWNIILNLTNFYLDSFFQVYQKNNILSQELLIQFIKHRKKQIVQNKIQQIKYAIDKQEMKDIQQQQDNQQSSLLNFFNINFQNKENSPSKSQQEQIYIYQQKLDQLLSDQVNTSLLNNYLQLKIIKQCIQDDENQSLSEYQNQLENFLMQDQYDMQDQIYYSNVDKIIMNKTIQDIMLQRNFEFFPLKKFSFYYDYFYQLIYILYSLKKIIQQMHKNIDSIEELIKLDVENIDKEQYLKLEQEIENKFKQINQHIQKQNKKINMLEYFIDELLFECQYLIEDNDNKSQDLNITFGKDSFQDSHLEEKISIIKQYFKSFKKIKKIRTKMNKQQEKYMSEQRELKKEKQNKEQEDTSIQDQQQNIEEQIIMIINFIIVYIFQFYYFNYKYINQQQSNEIAQMKSYNSDWKYQQIKQQFHQFY